MRRRPRKANVFYAVEVAEIRKKKKTKKKTRRLQWYHMLGEENANLK